MHFPPRFFSRAILGVRRRLTLAVDFYPGVSAARQLARLRSAASGARSSLPRLVVVAVVSARPPSVSDTA
eukprot:430300-Rhodomonas_salina.1